MNLVKKKGGNPAFYKGMPPLNPSGRPAQTWQPPSARADFLSSKYSTDQIIAFAKLISGGHKHPLTSQDAIVCIQLANILQLRDGLERERLYDRLFGKVPDRTINLNLNLDVSPDQLSERALALLQKIMPLDIEETEAIDAEVTLIQSAQISEVVIEDCSDLVDE